jgi:hypothetical protein
MTPAVRRPIVVGLAGVAAVVLAAGVATAVSRAHHDAVQALPPPCRDATGSTGGGLPSGRTLDEALGSVLRDGSPGASRQLAGSGALGRGTPQQLRARAKALQQPGAGQAPGAAGTGAGTGSQSPQPQQRAGDQQGGGGGAGGAGGGGAGAGSGPSTGPAGGTGQNPAAGPAGGHLTDSPQPVAPPPSHQAGTVPKRAGDRTSALSGWAWLAIATLALLAAVVAARWLARRRTPAEEDEAPALTAEEAARLAAQAADAQDHDAALRWTFVAGLLRLDTAGVLAYDPCRTSTLVARRLRSARFPGLVRGFDLVAYGGRHATATDVAAARRDWDLLVAETAGT